MIVSHQHKFIFIKTKKTAGTSLEIALSGICGPDDIITPITPEDEETRRALGFRGPQNYQVGSGSFYNHIPARLVRQVLGPEIWKDYFTFCFERNPWDKVLSWYYWEIGGGRKLTFEDFMKSGHFALVGGEGGLRLYTDEENKIILDQVYLYEDLQGALVNLAKRLQVESLPELPQAKSQYRKTKKPYQELYSESQKRMVEQAFQQEIKFFDYRF